MDVMTGLAAIGTATDIVKTLKDIERGADEAAFKLAIADLHMSLADAQISLSEARISLSEKDEEIHKLKVQLDALQSGEICPVCETGKLKTLSVKPHPRFGKQGLQEKQLSCSNQDCAHTEERMHDPNGLLKK